MATIEHALITLNLTITQLRATTTHTREKPELSSHTTIMAQLLIARI